MPPSLVASNPSSAAAGQTLDVTITGINTHFTLASGTFLNFNFFPPSGGSVVNFLNVVNDTSVIVNITIPPNILSGSYDIYSFIPIDGLLLLENGFTINGVSPPVLNYINPGNANAGQTLNVTISGSNTHFTQASSTTLFFNFSQGFSTASINSLTILNDTTIDANITLPPNIYTGTYDIRVNSTLDGVLFLFDGLSVNGITPPVLSSVTPNTGNPGQTLNVTITGANTHFTQGSGTYVDFGFNQGSGTTVVNSIFTLSDTAVLVNVTIPSGTFPGDYDVYLNNPIDGNLVFQGEFHVLAAGVGIREYEISFSLYPNPASERLTIECNASSENSRIIIYNIHGQIILNTLLINQKSEIDISELSSGIYFLRLSNPQGHSVKRFIRN